MKAIKLVFSIAFIIMMLPVFFEFNTATMVMFMLGIAIEVAIWVDEIIVLLGYKLE